MDLQSNVTLEELTAQTAVKFSCPDGRSVLTARGGDFGEFLFIKNYDRTETSKVYTQGVAERYKALDLNTLQTKNISDDIVLEGAEGLVLIKDDDAVAVNKRYAEKDVTKNFVLTDIGENYFVLDYVSVSRNGEPFSEYMPVQQAFEKLLREDYKGKLSVKQRFIARSPFKARLMAEKTKYFETSLNGTPLAFEQSDFDVNFVEADITDCLRTGENILLYTIEFYQHDGVSFALFDPMATESLRNCLYYDTSIENTYIKGDFVVEKDMSLSKRNALPTVSSDLYKNGYPFFKGEFTLKGKLGKATAGEAILDLQGRFLVANVFVNGKQIDFVTETKKDVAPFLTKESNDVVVKVKSSLRNLFGPHHYKPCAEPLALSPFTFTLRGDWGNGTSGQYTDEYNSVPFGIDKIILKEEF